MSVLTRRAVLSALCPRFHHSNLGHWSGVLAHFSSVQFKMISERSEKPIIMRSTPSLSSFPNVVFETVPVFV